MEVVRGDDLAARLSSGPMLLDEALPVARQIAEALETAHAAGIIHRQFGSIETLRVSPHV